MTGRELLDKIEELAPKGSTFHIASLHLTELEPGDVVLRLGPRGQRGADPKTVTVVRIEVPA